MRQVPDFSKASVLVVGDLMLDRYWHGSTSRISPEAPVPVVKVSNEEGRPGGAGNVALNIAALGGTVGLLGLVGKDAVATSLEKQLSNAGVACYFQVDETVPTITKLRIISRHQQLIRLDFEDGFPDYDAKRLLADYAKLIDQYDVIVLSDYGKGTLDKVQELITLAKEKNKQVLIDPKGADFKKYRGADLITPNFSELVAVVGDCLGDAEVTKKGHELLEQCQLTHLLVTRGESGMTLLSADQSVSHIPTMAQEVFDVTGAGDTVIGVLALGLAVGLDIASATQLANIAAGIVVGKLGTATTSYNELQHRINEHHVINQGVVSEAQLLEAVEVARHRGEKIVMTNGCFDILHAGHVTYLQEASRLGDRLIVAVNIDETVRQLKGPDRPVNKVENRMQVLAALGCIDWVVAFTTETPEQLICDVKPDLLVKGGDNDPDKIPGAKCVRENGGQVLALTYIDGISTTKIVSSIRDA